MEQLSDIAYQILGAVFLIQALDITTLKTEVDNTISKISDPKAQDLVKQQAEALAEGYKSGQITDETLPKYIQQFLLALGIKSLRFGGILNYINTLNKIRR